MTLTPEQAERAWARFDQLLAEAAGTEHAPPIAQVLHNIAAALDRVANTMEATT